MNVSGIQFNRSYEFEDFRYYENQFRPSQLQHHDHYLNCQPQQTCLARQRKTIREMFEEFTSKFGLDIQNLEEEGGLTPMSIKLWFRSDLQKNGPVIDKELIDLFIDKI